MSELATTISKSPRRRRWLLRVVLWSAGGAAGLALLTWFAFHACVRWWTYPEGATRRPPQAVILEDRDGEPLAALAARDGQWRFDVDGDRMSPLLTRAIVAVEDARFHDQEGIDWRAAAAATWQNASSFGVVRGASTITMQLHRLRAGTPRTAWGKWEQVVRARQIERSTSKDAILAEYLNRASFGGNLVGAEAASRRYFGKSADALTLAEAALLAGLPQNPNRLRPDRHPDLARARRDHVLHRMLACNYITRDDHDAAVAEPVVAAWRALPQDRDHGPPAEGAMPALISLADRSTGRTTIDASIQRRAATLAAEQLRRLNDPVIDSLAIVVLDNASAQCLASVSLCPSRPLLDLTRRPRSTGSTLKPFIYAAAFESGLATPQTVLDDSPAAWPGYRPRNFDGDHRGAMTAADALAESRNIPALALLSAVGVERTIGVMNGMGLRSLSRGRRNCGLSLAIGGADATPVEVAAAYAALARGGVHRPVTFNPATTTDSAPIGALPEWACWDALAALADEQRVHRVCPAAVGTNVAFKTGTSSDHRDAWCAAVTPRHTVVVWLGNAAGRGTKTLTGLDAAAPLALQIVAGLGRGDNPWPIRTVAAISPPPPRAPSSQQLVLISPADGTEFIIDPDAPRDRQRILLRAAAGSNDDELWWLIDGRRHAVTTGPHELWWSPAPGRHDVRVIDRRGRTASATLRVIE